MRFQIGSAIREMDLNRYPFNYLHFQRIKSRGYLFVLFVDKVQIISRRTCVVSVGGPIEINNCRLKPDKHPYFLIPVTLKRERYCCIMYIPNPFTED
jgi:hypothetical protein